MVDQALIRPKVYVWPPCWGCESLYPRCVMFMRLLNLRKVDYEVVAARFPDPAKKSAEDIHTVFMGMPGLEIPYQDRVFGYDRIMRYIVDNYDSRLPQDKIRYGLDQVEMAYQWINEVLLPNLVYLRWVKKQNLEKWWRGIQFQGSHEAIERKLSFIHERMKIYVARYPIANMNETEFQNNLKNSFKIVNRIIDQKKFMYSNQTMSLADISLFPVIQGFLGRGIDERSLLISEFPNLIRWFKVMDELTRIETSPVIDLP